MAKIITKYRGYTAAQLKSRASVPNAADMTVVGNTVECVNINTTKIRNAIGASINSLSGLSQSPLVNVWSGFGPTVRTIVGQALVNSVGAAPHGMGEFAGYNHNARIPGWITSAPSGDMWVNAGGDANFIVNVYVGEVQYQLISPAIVGITLAIYNSAGNLVAWGSRNFEDELVQDDVTSLTATISGVTIDATYTGKVWLVSDTSDFDDTQIICRLPNTSDFTQNVKIKALTNLTVNSNGFTVTSPGFNLPAGTCSFAEAYNLTGYTNVRIVAQLFNWLWVQVGTDVEMYNDAYYPPDMIYVTPAKPNGDPVDAYGYHFVITFYLTT